MAEEPNQIYIWLSQNWNGMLTVFSTIVAAIVSTYGIRRFLLDRTYN